VWSIMQKCWNEDPVQRPSFLEIAKQLKALLAMDDDESSEDSASTEDSKSNLTELSGYIASPHFAAELPPYSKTHFVPESPSYSKTHFVPESPSYSKTQAIVQSL